MKADSVEVLVVRRPFTTAVGGARRTFRKGAIVAAKDPVVKGREHLFVSPVEKLSR